MDIDSDLDRNKDTDMDMKRDTDMDKWIRTYGRYSMDMAMDMITDRDMTMDKDIVKIRIRT